MDQDGLMPLLRIGLAGLRHPTVAQRDDPVHPRRQLRIMRRDQRGNILTAHDMEQFLKHDRGRRHIQIAGRLIGEEHFRRIRQCPGDRYPLLLPTGQLARQMVKPCLQTKARQQGQ